MSELIAVDGSGLVIEVTPEPVPPPPPAVQVFPNAGIPPYEFGNGDVGLTPDSKCKCQGDAVLVTEITQLSPYAPPATGTADDFACDVLGSLIQTWIDKGQFSIPPTVDKVHASGEDVMRENDETVPGAPPLATRCGCQAQYVVGTTVINCIGSCMVKVKTAGQDKARAV